MKRSLNQSGKYKYVLKFYQIVLRKILFYSGLENIYEMVSRGKSELRLDLTAADGKTVYETFQNFSLGERPYYTLHIDKGVGTAGIHCRCRFKI
jgi:hypothetical protein